MGKAEMRGRLKGREGRREGRLTGWKAEKRGRLMDWKGRFFEQGK
jgi:hypothetical protein